MVDPVRPPLRIVVRGRHLGAEAGRFLRWRFLTRSTWHTANPFSLSAPS
jgi:hypothetical protein